MRYVLGVGDGYGQMLGFVFGTKKILIVFFKCLLFSARVSYEI